MGTLAGERKERRVGNGRLGEGRSPDRRESGPVEEARRDPEVSARAVRRQYSAKYKLKILKKVDGCKGPGQIGEILRREGLYSSHLTTWRRQRDEGTLEGLKPKKRGRKGSEKNPLETELKKVKRENERLQRKLAQAEAIIDIQKKVSTLLGIPLEAPEREEKS